MNGLLANVLGGAIGGGLSSYADTLKKEAAQAREERLKQEEREYQESVRQEGYDRQDAQIAQRNEREDKRNKILDARYDQAQSDQAARNKLLDERWDKQYQASLNAAQSKAEREKLKDAFELLKFKNKNIDSALDKLQEKEMSIFEGINTSKDEFGNVLEGAGSLSKEQMDMYREVVRKRDSLLAEQDNLSKQMEMVLSGKKPEQEKTPGKIFDSSKLSDFVQRVAPSQEHEALAALEKKGVDPSVIYEAKTLFQQRRQGEQEHKGLLHNAAVQTESNRRQFAHEQPRFEQLNNFLEGFKAAPRKLSDQEKTQIQQLISEVTPQTQQQQDLVKALANIIRY